MMTEALLLLAVTFCINRSWALYDLKRQMRQQDTDDMNQLDAWANTQENSKHGI